MKVSYFDIPDLVLFTPDIYGDERGFFFESFNEKKFQEATKSDHTFVQDNHSKSSKGVLRGLHYQLPEKDQGKLVRVVQGAVFDVAVDIRKSSLHFGKWIGVILTSENKQQLWIPPGFAHGFVTLSETSEFLYKTTDFYSPEHERCIAWDDPSIGIDWNLDLIPSLSAKDKLGKSLVDSIVFD